MTARKALVIDDDAELCEELAELLRDEGFKVKVAPDVYSGLALLTLGGFDIAILDYKMPGMNGLELLKKASGSRIKTAVFLVSGKPFIERMLQDAGLSEMVRAVMSKPFDPDKLLERIRTLAPG